jgi:hypothetical protein
MGVQVGLHQDPAFGSAAVAAVAADWLTEIHFLLPRVPLTLLGYLQEVTPIFKINVQVM